MVLWVSGSGSIEGRCGGKVFGRDVHGVYRPGNDLEVRLGGRMFGETLRLAMQSRAHISGRIGGMVTGCRIEADVLGSAVAGWCARSFNLQRISIQSEDMDALVMLMIGCTACYFGYFLHSSPDLTS
jgi:hypothetical protein